MKKQNFAIRTIRNGSVKINNKTFYVDSTSLEYDGRLDGMRFAFGLYWGDEDKFLNFISLWGTEEEYYADKFYDTEGFFRPQVINGEIPWLWWKTKK